MPATMVEMRTRFRGMPSWERTRTRGETIEKKPAALTDRSAVARSLRGDFLLLPHSAGVES